MLLDSDPGKVSFAGQEELAVGVPFFATSTGKVHFEVACEGSTGKINVGLAGTNFQGNVVSGCEASWSIYSNGTTYHRQITCASWFRHPCIMISPTQLSCFFY